MITDDEIQKAVDWLRDNADEAAQARANRVVMEEGRKCVKAKLMKEHVKESIGAQEREAYADNRYQLHLDGLKEAVLEDERFRMLRAAADAKIEAWRTMQANQRGSWKA